MLVVRLFQLAVEAGPAKALVDRLEPGEDACEQLLEGERGLVGPQKRVERGGGCGVGGVETDAYDEVVVAGGVGGVDEDAADLDVFLLTGFREVLSIWRVFSGCTSCVLSR